MASDFNVPLLIIIRFRRLMAMNSNELFRVEENEWEHISLCFLIEACGNNVSRDGIFHLRFCQEMKMLLCGKKDVRTNGKK